jgi:NADPH-dependent 2,4-dienoyl-CoA reductase/sulfur reductase-like enzyme/rhodanese-related sulfurtransferase
MPQKVVVIGAVALGPKAACRFKRLKPDSKVIMVDRDDLISYGGCGIPYFISGDVSEAAQLQETSFHMLRDKEFFREAKDIEVFTRTEVLAIDREEKSVLTRDLTTGEQTSLPYDKLVIATGSRPKRLNIPGIDLDGVFSVSNMNAAIAIKERISSGKVDKAVIIGGGFIGLEMAEALTDMWGIETTVVEITDQLLPGLISRNMAQIAQRHMEENGVEFRLQDRVERLEGEGKVERAITSNGSLEADLVIAAVGIEPNSDLAISAGLDVSSRGGILVNKKMQTSDPDIYAGGDCVEVTNLITGKPGYYPLGAMANRQGRVIGTNLTGGNSEFPGAVGSFVVKLFEMSVAAAGLSIEVACREGFDAVCAHVAQFDRAHFFPEKDLMYLELVVEKGTERVLGIQGVGNKGDGTVGRINALAPLLQSKPTVEDTAENILAKKNRVLDVDEFDELWQRREDGEVIFLDCRGWGNAEPFVEKYPEHWKNIPQDELRARLAEVPRDKKLVLICNTGVRSYEAQVTLDHMGITDSCNLQGGVACIKKWGLDLV